MKQPTKQPTNQCPPAGGQTDPAKTQAQEESYATSISRAKKVIEFLGVNKFRPGVILVVVVKHVSCSPLKRMGKRSNVDPL